MRVKILLDPTGPYGLCNMVGEVCEVNDDLALKLIETKHAEKTNDQLTKDDGLRYATITDSNGQPKQVRVK